MNEEVSALRLHGAALDSSDAFSLFHEFINTIDTRLDSQDVEHKQMLDNMKQQRHINDF